MKCPSCGNSQAECVIGSFWVCPASGCPNSKLSQAQTKLKQAGEWSREYLGDWKFVDPQAALHIAKVPIGWAHPRPPTDLYQGSPWVPGQHKIARGAGRGYTRFDYPQAQIFDTEADLIAKHSRRTNQAGFSELVVALVRFDPSGVRPRWVLDCIHPLP